jgi:hypothetical protein
LRQSVIRFPKAATHTGMLFEPYTAPITTICESAKKLSFRVSLCQVSQPLDSVRLYFLLHFISLMQHAPLSKPPWQQHFNISCV